ncbi:MAG: magnesium transporter [Candidatus Parcubacteria bacterium]|jgi:magnesium transporter|nr:magnesium transporter [Candidatus Parcubacteria bacterium]
MISTHSYRGVVWLDLESPSDDEILGLVKRYGLHPLVGEELKRSSALAKIDFYKDYILVVLTLPVRVRQNPKGADVRGGAGAVTHEIVDREIDFVIGKSFLITARTETIEQLEYFGKIFETNAILAKDEKIDHAGFLFYYMVKRIYAGMVEDLENIRDSLIAAETRIYEGDERKMVQVLSALSRELIDIKQTVRIHREVWDEMVRHADKNLFGGDFGSYIHDMRDEFNVIHELIVNARELLTDLRETNDSLLSTKQNETIKMLTLITVIFYPATFIAAAFTVPADYVPIIESQNGWAILMVIMVLVTVGVWWYVKKRRWV